MFEKKREHKTLMLSFEYFQDEYYRAEIRYGSDTLLSLLIPEEEIKVVTKLYSDLFAYDDASHYMDLLCKEMGESV